MVDLRSTNKGDLRGISMTPKKEHKPTKEKKAKPSHEQQIAELIDTLKRVQADFENYKKRSEKQQQEFIKYATAGFVKSLLPIIDNFELAMQHQDNTEEFVKGIKLMHEQLWKVLHQAGIEKIESTGKLFDPEAHEALMAEESDQAENTVLQELFAGYKMKDTVLRPAKVKVAKKKQLQTEEAKKEQ